MTILETVLIAALAGLVSYRLGSASGMRKAVMTLMGQVPPSFLDRFRKDKKKPEDTPTEAANNAVLTKPVVPETHHGHYL